MRICVSMLTRLPALIILILIPQLSFGGLRSSWNEFDINGARVRVALPAEIPAEDGTWQIDDPEQLKKLGVDSICLILHHDTVTNVSIAMMNVSEVTVVNGAEILPEHVSADEGMVPIIRSLVCERN